MAGRRFVPAVGLQHATRVQVSLGLDIGGMRLFWRGEDAKVGSLASDLDGRDPFLSHASLGAGYASNPKKAGRARCVPIAHVLRIELSRHVAQVGNSVVRPAPVDVVDFTVRPFAGHIEPREAVRIVPAPIHTNDDVSRHSIDTSDCGAGSPAPTMGRCRAREHASLWIVVKQFAQTLRGKIGRSHEAALSLIGQGPAAIRSRLRASLFSPLALPGAT